MSKPKQPFLVIVGPTASGKSALGMHLAQKYDGEIICADSRTVYRGMDIGTAKPSAEDQALVPHHLLDVVEPNESYSAGQFKQLAEAAIADITRRGKLPIMVGGTGLYIDAVLYDYQFPETRDEAKTNEWATWSLEKLQAQAQNIEGLNDSDWANKRRLIRALELQNTSKMAASKSTDPRAETLTFGMRLNKEVIQKRIHERIVFMLNKGLINEVRKIGSAFGWDGEAMTGVCYRAFKTAALDSKPTSEMIEAAMAEVEAGDRRLVKKQLTWFKRNPHIVWLDAEDETRLQAAAEELVEKWLKGL